MLYGKEMEREMDNDTCFKSIDKLFKSENFFLKKNSNLSQIWEKFLINLNKKNFKYVKLETF